jgi:hypothetical protein
VIEVKKRNKRNKKIINNKTSNIFSNQKGMALLTTLIFVFILVTLAVALLTMTINDTKLSALQRDSTSAFYLAETGVDKALWYLNTPSDNGVGGLDWRTYNDETGPVEGYTDGYLIENYPSGLTNYYKVKVKDITLSDTDLIDPIQINSYGAIYDGNKIYGKRQIQVIAVKKVSQNPEVAYNHAIATETDLTLNGGISIHDGSVHSNGDITNNGTYDIDGAISAVGTIAGIGGDDDASYENLPKVDFEYYKNLADTHLHGGDYYPTSVMFNTDDDSLTGIHFIDGDVIIKAELVITGGAIFATGTITTLGNGSIIHSRADYGENDPLTNNPLAIIARGDITFGGSSVSTDGIVQTDGKITINGDVTIDNGAVYAGEGVLNGGGGTINITYDPTLFGQIIPGVGSEVYKILSWQEVYN